jgi:hypothetical protein
MTIDGNMFHNNTAYILEYGNTDEAQMAFTLTAKNNEVYGCEDFFIDYYGSSSTIDTFDYDGKFIIQENDVHNNSGGFVHIWGDVTVTDNTFTDNQGPLALIDHINLNIPMVKDNVLVNNVDLYAFVGKDRGYQLIPMSMGNDVLSCSGTGLSFTNMEVRLDDLDIINAATAIRATNAYVDAYSCSIACSACKVLGDGLITSWWPMELSVTWGDNEGTDSETPTANALVVFYNAEGDYYTSAYADENGKLGRTYHPQFAVDLAGSIPYSPYTIKASAAGVANETEDPVVLDMDLVGPNALHLVLWDSYEPDVAITEPYMGAMFNVDALTAIGFVAEVGSGLDMVEINIGSGWEELVLNPGGDWQVELADLTDGEVTVEVRASDIAGNVKVSSVVVTIDTIPPELTVTYDAERTNVTVITLTGTIEDGAELFINGISMGVAEGNDVSEEYELHEGPNLIVLEAFDAAGNKAEVTLNVILDTFDPVLVITGPADGVVTNMDTITVTGITEEDATLTVGGTPVVPDEGGMFSFDHSLSEGENYIDIIATDLAGNTVSATRMAFLDQNAPSLEITDPDDGTVVDTQIIVVHIVADEDAVLSLNGRVLPDTGDVLRTVLLAEGPNTITVIARDAAGNEATETITVMLDTRPPVLSVTMPEAMEVWTNADSIDLAGLAEDATGVTVNGIAAVYTNAPAWSYTFQLSPGENNITVEATDGVNKDTEVLKVWKSNVLPTLNVDAMEPNIKVPSVTVTGNTEPGIDTVTMEFGGVTEDFSVNPDGTFAVFLTLADGTYDVQVSVTDTYGNTQTASTGSFTVKAKQITGDDTDDGGPQVEPMQIGLLLAVIGITLVIAAFAAAYAKTRHERE